MWPGWRAGILTWLNSSASGSLVVADGMPLVWAARAGGQVLPERVTGSALVLSLSAAAAADGRSVFILGGAAGVPDKAAEALRLRSPDLRVVGTDSPPFGFDRTAEGVRQAVAAVVAAAPDLVLVGLGFPKQEKLIEQLRRAWPNAWYLACGGGIPMAAGVAPGNSARAAPRPGMGAPANPGAPPPGAQISLGRCAFRDSLLARTATRRVTR